MKINEVLKAIVQKRHDLKMDNPQFDYEPKLEIYMDYDFWTQCAREITGMVSSTACEFMQSNTIYGYKVWRVPPQNFIDGEKHVPYRIVNLDA